MYTVYKSAARTAKENALIKHNNKTLYDFSIIDASIPDDIKTAIINQSIKDTEQGFSDFTFILYDVSSNERATANIYFKIFDVEDDMKRLYRIYKAVKIEYLQKSIDPWYGTEKIINQFTKTIGYEYRRETITITE